MKKLVFFGFLFFFGWSWAGNIKTDVIDPYYEVRLNGNVLGGSTAIKINNKTYFLTAHHVVAEYLSSKEQNLVLEVYKKWQFGEVLIKTKVSFYSEYATHFSSGKDMALLEPIEEPIVFRHAKINKDIMVDTGDDCWYIGSPSKLHSVLEKSIISNHYHESSEPNHGGEIGHKYYMVGGLGWHGNSGGGLFVKSGQDYYLVGIVVRKACVLSPKTFVLCERLDTICSFLDDFNKVVNQK